MRYFRYYHPLAIVALIALATSSTWTIAVDARPLELAVHLEKRQAVHAPEAAAPPVAAPDPPQTSAPPKPDNPSPTSKPPPPTSPRDPPPPVTTDRPEPPPPTKNPQPTQQPQPPPPKPVSPNPPPSHQLPSPHPSSESSSNSHSTATNTHSVSSGTLSANAPQSTSPTTGMPEDGSEVPTKVSDKVFIGLGAVGSLFLFALGGLAFCRHRKKKNLAAALLEQTAQFNHNNPYAKISEATVNSNNANMSGKESLPMTPTKPIGTFSVVSDYTPAMPDEIEIYYGDSVTVLQEYDDGWCMGINNSRGGIKGVVPRHCLSGGHNNNNNTYDGGHHGGQYDNGGDDGYYPPNPGFKAMANKRMSSIPAGGWNNGPGGYQGGAGGYADYPPPNNHYNQGGHLGPPGQGYYGGY
ncbi:hypothetical protein BGZ95_006629 [Linnemannia exigua]|uniref:SH3 domain-containing protein n=1 Tax=Linnemannia exigua TaxID=604196 RepID=A0AAD4DND5_9FUNG|nr:hypothetical protein BGZ95_006629 [Linnemannia exigua]